MIEWDGDDAMPERDRTRRPLCRHPEPRTARGWHNECRRPAGHPGEHVDLPRRWNLPAQAAILLGVLIRARRHPTNQGADR